MYGLTQRIRRMEAEVSREVEILRKVSKLKGPLSSVYIQWLAQTRFPGSNNARKILKLRKSLKTMTMLRYLAWLFSGIGVAGAVWGGSHYMRNLAKR